MSTKAVVATLALAPSMVPTRNVQWCSCAVEEINSDPATGPTFHETEAGIEAGIFVANCLQVILKARLPTLTGGPGQATGAHGRRIQSGGGAAKVTRTE